MTVTRMRRVAAVSALAVTTPLVLASTLAAAAAETEVDRPATFTSGFTVKATPDAVIDPDGKPAPGEEGATGTFTYMINSDEDVICYDITVDGVTPPYQSMAKTATHLHEAPVGKGGPPRISFPNPEGDGDTLTSSGCLKGPFTTGLDDDEGNDTGDGFTLDQIEANPAGFSSDTHTSAFVPGAVRGQLTVMPLGGVDTGLGGAADAGLGTAGITGLSVLAVAGAVGAGFLVRRTVRS